MNFVQKLTILGLSYLIGSTIVQAQSPEEVLNALIKTVSPVEISDLIRKQGIQYDRALLHQANATEGYTTDFKRAVNLGIYSTDLGYASINDQNQDALQYLGSLKKMATGLGVGEYIDFQKVLSLAMNKNNLNALLEETSNTFESMSMHLEEQKKSNLAALMLTGGWLETLYLTCEVAKKYNSAELNERIVSQKFILDQILKVLESFQAQNPSDSEMRSLVRQLKLLHVKLDKYSSGLTVADGKTNVKDEGGMLVVTGSPSNNTEINITAADLRAIATQVIVIRNDMIK